MVLELQYVYKHSVLACLASFPSIMSPLHPLNDMRFLSPGGQVNRARLDWRDVLQQG
jgi:hypothetical protein